MTSTKPTRWVRRPGERPQELLDAAIQVFSTQGYRATRLEQVAEVAGVTKGSIYYYFASKEELLAESFKGRIGAIFAEVKGVADRAVGSPPERLCTVLEAAWTKWGIPETARMYRLLTGEVRTELPALFDALMKGGLMQLWQLVAGIILDGQATGAFATTPDPLASARFIVTGLMQQAFLLADLRERGLDATPPAKVFEASMVVALRGLGDRGPSPRPA
ncbi:MAG TPA: TetR/AcrR family transcriptional regulator [Gemmatimonadaceae bacterium]